MPSAANGAVKRVSLQHDVVFWKRYENACLQTSFLLRNLLEILVTCVTQVLGEASQVISSLLCVKVTAHWCPWVPTVSVLEPLVRQNDVAQLGVTSTLNVLHIVSHCRTIEQRCLAGSTNSRLPSVKGTVQVMINKMVGVGELLE